MTRPIPARAGARIEIRFLTAYNCAGFDYCRHSDPMKMKRPLALLLSFAILAFSMQPLHAEEEEGAPKKPIYYAMEPAFVVNINEGGRRTHFMQITVQLMSRSQEVIDKVEANQPPLRDAMIMLLAHQTGETMRSVQGREKVRQEALEDVRKVMEKVAGVKKGIEAVYFTDFVIQ